MSQVKRNWLIGGSITAGIFIFLIVLGAIIGDTEPEPPTPSVGESEATIEPITTLAESPKKGNATPEPKEWTVEELADCDTSALKRQSDSGTNPTGAKSSACEIALVSAQLKTLTAMREELQPSESARMMMHFENTSAMFNYLEQLSGDRVLDKREIESFCYVLPQQETQLQEATDYIYSLGVRDLQCIELDVL